jgi:hypothetical protein
MEKTKILFKMIMHCIILFCIGIIPLACNIFNDDGIKSTQIGPRGYFYFIDKTSANLLMLDMQLNELKKWDLYRITGDSSLQGITFDGRYIWISSSGSADKIFQVDASQETLTVLKSFDAPPQRHGTIRDIAWDGSYLWAVNSGSLTYNETPALYKLDPTNGTVLNQYILPSHDPRGLTYYGGSTDVYGKATDAGLCYSDVTSKMVYFFRREFAQFDTLFSAPIPPRGKDYRLPIGLTYDGLNYWLVNGSTSTAADHLYKLSSAGKELSRFDLPYESPGPIAYSTVDVRIPAAPSILSLVPNSGVRGETLPVTIIGDGFRSGAELSVDFGDGIRVDSINYISAKEIYSVITIDSDAVAGRRSLTVTNPGGRSTTADSVFEVTLFPKIPKLWLADQQYDSLYQIRMGDTTIVNRWSITSITGSAQGLAFDGTNIWLSASGTERRIYKIDTTGSVLTALSSIASPTASGTLRGVAWEAGSIWLAISQVVASVEGRIYRLDPSTGIVLDSVATPGYEPRGIVFANGNLYCNDTNLDSVYVYNSSSRGWKSVFQTPTVTGASRFATGLAWDGNSFWIANSTTNSDYLFKVTPAGVILQIFRPVTSGDPQLTGLVYTSN